MSITKRLQLYTTAEQKQIQKKIISALSSKTSEGLVILCYFPYAFVASENLA